MIAKKWQKIDARFWRFENSDFKIEPVKACETAKRAKGGRKAKTSWLARERVGERAQVPELTAGAKQERLKRRLLGEKVPFASAGRFFIRSRAESAALATLPTTISHEPKVILEFWRHHCFFHVFYTKFAGLTQFFQILHLGPFCLARQRFGATRNRLFH